MSKYIGVYEMFREYGGPEEGGWYFDAGTLAHVETIPEGVTPEYVQALCSDLEEAHRDPEARPIHSVLYDGGIFEAFTFDTMPPRHFPEEYPRWE